MRRLGDDLVGVGAQDVELDRPVASLDAGRELLGQLIWRRGAGRDVGVGRHPVAVAAKQPPAGLAEALAEQVPERDVERADRADDRALLAVATDRWFSPRPGRKNTTPA